MTNKVTQPQPRTTNTLLQAMKEENNLKTTENGAVALKSTFSPLLDLFGQIGALRSRAESEILSLFSKAYAVDRLLAMKTLFYARDIRGGLGERNTFRIILRDLAFSHPADVLVNLPLISEYGRWDDLFVLMGTPLEKATLALISEQFSKDMDALSTKSGAPISLLAKWMPSENASSPKTKKLATTLRVYLGLTSREYRKALTALRSAIKIVETKMSAREWEDIDYSSVPSTASLRYRAAFTRHDAERYAKFLEQVATGEKKINASTLYPYDLVRNYIGGSDLGNINPTIEAQWKALPDYITKKDQDFLVMADVSGSMYSDYNTPISTSVGLAIYFAERSKGAFANHFITFTDVPELVEIPKNLSLREKVKLVLRTEGFDTNLEAAFELVLKSAIKNNVAPKDMPTAIVIISDMEINEFGNCSHDDFDGTANVTFTEEMSRRFADAGYIMPTLVYWNVDARENTFHAIESDNVRFVSGSSPSVFKGLCENLGYSAYELMMAVINASRYDAVKISK